MSEQIELQASPELVKELSELDAICDDPSYKPRRRWRAGLPHLLREGVLAFHGSFCYYCRVPITLDTCHIDHVDPFSHSRNNSLANLVPSCAPCNLAKGRYGKYKTRKEICRMIAFVRNIPFDTFYKEVYEEV